MSDRQVRPARRHGVLFKRGGAGRGAASCPAEELIHRFLLPSSGWRGHGRGPACWARPAPVRLPAPPCTSARALPKSKQANPKQTGHTPRPATIHAGWARRGACNNSRSAPGLAKKDAYLPSCKTVDPPFFLTGRMWIRRCCTAHAHVVGLRGPWPAWPLRPDPWPGPGRRARATRVDLKSNLAIKAYLLSCSTAGLSFFLELVLIRLCCTRSWRG